MSIEEWVRDAHKGSTKVRVSLGTPFFHRFDVSTVLLGAHHPGLSLFRDKALKGSRDALLADHQEMHQHKHCCQKGENKGVEAIEPGQSGLPYTNPTP